MATHDKIGQQLHNEFLQRWPAEKISSMSLEEYNSQGNSDTFCAWLERHTKPIGIISGRYSTIFEIFERQKGHTGLRARGFKNDDHYTWRQRQGDTAEQAFQNVRNLILEIIRFAQAGELEAIERIILPPMLRWKIAFLYAPVGSMVAVFAPGHIISIGAEIGLKSKSVPALHRALATLKPSNQGIYSFSADLFFRNSLLFSARSRLYYVIGSKYGIHANEDRSQEMFEASAIATDFGPKGLPLNDYYLSADKEDLQKYLEENDCYDLENATQNLFSFLNIRVGDLVALKSSGNPKGGTPYLRIIAYAVVAERNGTVYYYDESLGHCLNVEYLNTELSLELPQGGYGKTVNPVIKQDARQSIFGDLFGVGDIRLVAEIEEQSLRRRRKGIQQLNTMSGTRQGTGPSVINYHHRTIQKSLLEYLQKQTDVDVVAEEDYVDITLRKKSNGTLEIYEVKPYSNPKYCIREALGQLLYYAQWHKDANLIRLFVVGPTPAAPVDRDFIAYIQEKLAIDFDYKSWPADFQDI
jgi:hypothetical protein